MTELRKQQWRASEIRQELARLVRAWDVASDFGLSVGGVHKSVGERGETPPWIVEVDNELRNQAVDALKAWEERAGDRDPTDVAVSRPFTLTAVTVLMLILALVTGVFWLLTRRRQ